MRKIKFLSIMLVLCIMTMLVSACSTPGSSGTTKADPKETVTKAYQKLTSLKNYHITMNVATSIIMQNKKVNMALKSEMDIQQNPMVCKSTMNIVTDMGAKQDHQKIVQYIEEAGDQFTIYSNMNNQWVKQSLPKNSYNPLDEYHDYMKAITRVTLKSEDANASVFTVVASGSALQAQIQKKLTAMGMQKMNITEDLFKDMGDFTYTIIVDKKTGNISKIDIDLSNFMAKIGDNMAKSKDVPEDQKKIVKEMFGNMKITSSMTLSQFNSLGKITIPEEAKK